MNPNLLRIRGFLITGFHLVVIAISLSVAFWIRFEFSLESLASPLLVAALIVAIPIKITAFSLGSLQEGWWRYAGLSDLVRIFLGLGAGLRLLRQADPYVDPGVAQRQRMGVALAAVAEDRDILALDQGQVGVVVVEHLGHDGLSFWRGSVGAGSGGSGLRIPRP